MSSKPTWSQESGASLVAIMVSLAIFAVVAMMASRSFQNINVSGRRVEAAMSAREAENLIIQALSQRFRSYIEGGCVQTPTNFFSSALPENQISTLATIDYKNVRFYTPLYAVTAAPQEASTDLSRCQKTPFTGAPSTAVADTFYACLDIATQAGARNQASKDAFAANRGAFIEMYVKLKSLKTDQPVICTAMAQGVGLGFEIYYALHWTTSAGDRVMYDSKMGTFNVAY